MKKKKENKPQAQTLSLNLTPQKSLFSKPLVVKLKNLTDEKLYNVKLFDLEYAKQSKVAYSTSPLITYDELLMCIHHRTENIIRIRKIAICDYKKFEFKQLCCDFKYTEFDANGRLTETLIDFIIDAYQTQDSVCDKDVKDMNMVLSAGANIVSEFLMPEAEMIILLYPNINIKK